MNTRLEGQLAEELLRLIDGARPPLPDAELWMRIIEGPCSRPVMDVETRKAPSELGTRRAEQGVTIESLVNEFSLVRRLFEEKIGRIIMGVGGQDHPNVQTVRAGLDAALASAVNAYVQRRSIEARRDPVTGLLDRAAFDVCLSEEIGRANRYHRDFSLILFDLDHFKSINDRLGHPEGDRVLAEVGQVLSRTLRRSDQVFRYGGDEFAALCLETGERAMRSVLERIERNLGKITISSGVASFPTEATDAEELVRLADERLYQCKRSHHKTLP